ncbi:MAG: rRNA maturation RNase YbeY [Alphaproteobacteria bacterium]|nr:rRNA maturation RNase YbeY [Alphaproteobacteria bacterium]
MPGPSSPCSGRPRAGRARAGSRSLRPRGPARKPAAARRGAGADGAQAAASARPATAEKAAQPEGSRRARPRSRAARRPLADAAIEVVLADPGWRRAVPAPALLVARAAQAALAAGARASKGLSVLLADDAALRALNRRHRGIDKPTNVLSFPAPPAAAQLGDIAIARETVLREAAALGKAPAHHLVHMVVHGVLHLCGADHDTPSRARRMEGRERAILAGLGVADPYAATAAAPSPPKRRRP